MKFTSTELSRFRSVSQAYTYRRWVEESVAQQAANARMIEIQRQAGIMARRIEEERNGENMTDGVYVNV